MNIETKTKNINSKSLFEEVNKFFVDVFESYNVDFYSFSEALLTDIIEEWVHTSLDGKIEQYDFICDARNNKKSDLKNGRTHVTFKYRQRNCLNITEINYIITE